MKIIKKDYYNLEKPTVVAMGVEEEIGKRTVCLLNGSALKDKNHYYMLIEDNYENEVKNKYVETIEKMVKSMEQTALYLDKYEELRRGLIEKDEFDTTVKNNTEELMQLQDKYNKLKKEINKNL